MSQDMEVRLVHNDSYFPSDQIWCPYVTSFISVMRPPQHCSRAWQEKLPNHGWEFSSKIALVHFEETRHQRTLSSIMQALNMQDPEFNFCCSLRQTLHGIACVCGMCFMVIRKIYYRRIHTRWFPTPSAQFETLKRMQIDVKDVLF